jgi:pyruvate/2-oxoglutarate dehydrogenase complex dihydrolipoamide acyltransferase (E2) component
VADEVIAEIVVPQLDANADEYRLADLSVPDHSLVNVRDCVAVVETSKSVFEIETPASGRIYFAPGFGPGQAVRAGQVLAVLVHPAVSNPDLSRTFQPVVQECESSLAGLGATFSNAALRRLRELKIPPELFRGKGLVTTADVEAYLKERPR